MNNENKRIFAERLTALADAMGGKLPQTSQGMAIWMDTLEDLPDWAVLKAVNSWMKHSNRFPTAYDLRKEARELIDLDLERQAQKSAEEMPTVSQVVSFNPERASQFDAYRKAVKPYLVTDPLAHIWKNTTLYAQNKLPVDGIAKLKRFYGHEPTEKEIEEAWEKYLGNEALAYNKPKASEFFV